MNDIQFQPAFLPGIDQGLQVAAGSRNQDTGFEWTVHDG
jgi:hypothetical protein